MTQRMPGPEDRIASFLHALAQARWLSPYQRSWPTHVWHYSDVHNVAAILREGRIYSRNRLIQLDRHPVEIAQLEIIEQSPWAHDYVRFYFRPRTPTLHQIEGVRPARNIVRAHCPVPVYLAFSAVRMLSRSDCECTASNFSRREARRGAGIEFLESLSFPGIYHDAPLGDGDEKRRIIGARCAEVIIPEEVDLRDLEEVICRSPAERETLLYLLKEQASAWRGRIRVERAGERLFFREWPFVHEVRLLAREILIRLGGRRGEPFTYVVDTLVNEVRSSFEGSVHGVRISVPLAQPAEVVGVRVRLEGVVAFLARVRKPQVLGR